MTTTVTPQSWAQALLTKLGAPVTRNNMISVLAWEEAEGGHFHNGAHWNPLNTTLDGAKYGTLPGNSAGVAVYPDYQTGLNETVATLREPRYAAVVHDLKTSAAPSTTTGAVASSPWGTWQGSSPAPNVQTAAAQVHQHPGWVTAGSGTTTIGGKPKPGKPAHHTAAHHKPTPHKTAHHKPPHATHHGPPNPGAPSTTNDKIVLDLAELNRLSTAYATASQDVLGVRRQLISLQEQLAPAVGAIADAGVKNSIAGAFEWLTGLDQSFDSSARQFSDISDYTHSIDSLARQADSADGGSPGPGAAERFAKSHPYPKRGGPAWEAVFAALNGGHIYRTAPPKGADPGRPSGTRAGNGGSTATSPTTPERASKVITLADSQHYHESGVNDTKYGAWFGEQGQPWCAMYVSWVFAHAGTPLPAIDGPHGYASVSHGIQYAAAHHELVSTPKPGDIFLYKNGDHTGIVTKVFPNGSFETSEGNWSNQVVHLRRANDGTYDFWNPYPAGSS